MRELFVYYAKANKVINGQLNQILGTMGPDPYDLKLEGYFFKTLGQILDHLFAADMIWMKAISDLGTRGLDLVSAVRAVPEYDEPVFSSFAEYLEFRSKLDDFILASMDNIDDSLLARTLTRRTKTGSLIDRPVSQVLVHFFNHQTHHRGQISRILDSLGIENNYSNMILLEF